MTESFEDAIKALRHISRGNGNVMRIADRIVAAHERELAAAKLGADTQVYDVDWNERHKAACELRDMKIGKPSTHWSFVCSLAARLHIPRPEDEPYEDYEIHNLIRRKLVSLLEGECNFSTPESYMACEDGGSNPAEMSGNEEKSVTLGTYSPITGELRAAMRQWGWIESDGSITFATSPTPPSVDAEQSLAISGSDFDRHCDAIDSVHAQLERENKDLRMKFVNANRHALHMERENESLKAELDRVLGEQEDKALTYEEAEQLCRRAFDGGATYGSESMRYGVNARAYDWEHWLEKHESLFTAKPTDTWESVIYDAMQAGRTDASVDVTPLIERCKALAGEDR